MTTSPKQEIISMYDRAAATYDQVGIRAGAYFGQRLVEHLAIPPGARVLDVATGRGALLFPAAERVGPAGRVTGIDLAPAMLAATAAEIHDRGLAQAEVCQMDGEDPKFPEHTFDFILCGFALNFLDHARALPRFRQLLKPGGTFATVGAYTPTEHPGLEPWQWLFQLTHDVFPPNFQPPAHWTSPNRLNTPERMAQTLNEAGFAAIDIWREEEVLYFTDEDDWWAWQWSQGSRFWLEGMSPAGLEMFKTVAFEKLASMKGPQGIPIPWGAQFATGKAPTLPQA